MKLTVESRLVGTQDGTKERWAYFVFEGDEQVRWGGWYSSELAAYRVGSQVSLDQARRILEERKALTS